MFVDMLETTLELTIKGTTTKILAGNLKNFDFELTPWGYSGFAEWWVVNAAAMGEDKLFTPFIGKDLITLKLSVARAYKEIAETSEEKPVPLVLQGIVTEREVFERVFPRMTGTPILHRRYRIHFGDRGAVTWMQHRPTKLYVDKTLKDLIDDNKPDGVNIDHAWQASSATQPVLALGLGTNTNDAPGATTNDDTNDATYYDFLFWLFDRLNVGFYYDIANDKYKIADEKPTGEAVKLRQVEVDNLEIVLPPLRRNSVTVLNSYVEAATKTKDITNADGITGVRVDHLIRSQVAADLDTRVTLETARTKQREIEAKIVLRQYPAQVFVPGMLVQLGPEWSPNLYQNAKKYRIVTARFEAKAQKQDAADDDGDKTNGYQMKYELDVELDSDPIPRLRHFVRPVWPFYVEGKVLSETGAEKELTFQPYQDSQTSLYYYKVKIPLWDDIKVIVPFEPLLQPAHYFFPMVKDERVLVALYFDKARIRSFLEWRPDGGQLPTDTQGNHLLLGKKDKNQTSIQHVYVDSKPVMTITRTLDADTQKLTISEGMIKWETRDH